MHNFHEQEKQEIKQQHLGMYEDLLDGTSQVNMNLMWMNKRIFCFILAFKKIGKRL